MLGRVRGIIGGTFDPPHLAHLAAAESAFRQLDLERVAFVPAGMPWQKSERGVSAAHHRWAMTELVVDGIGYFFADDREIHRDGPTYSIDTLDQVDGDDVVFVIGADTAVGIPTWHRWREVLERARFAVVPRRGVTEADVRSVLPAATWVDMPELDISGTDLRRRAADGASLRFLVPDPVWNYVRSERLYTHA